MPDLTIRFPNLIPIIVGGFNASKTIRTKVAPINGALWITGLLK
jgi:hypothetical protein